MSYGDFKEVQALIDSGPINARIRGLCARLGDSIIDNFNWYAWCLLAAGVVSAFQYFVGQRKLALLAYQATIGSLLLFWLALVFPIAGLVRHLVLTTSASLKIAKEAEVQVIPDEGPSDGFRSGVDLLLSKKGISCLVKVSLSTLLILLGVCKVRSF